MKKILLLLFPLFVLLTNCKAQELVFDALVTGTLVNNHIQQQRVLKSIKSSERNIEYYKTYISIKLEQLKKLETKTFEYLSEVQIAVKNVKDIVYASDVAKDIAIYQKKAFKVAQGNPELTLVVVKTEAELIKRTTDLFIHISTIALDKKGKNFLNSKERLDIIKHVVDELRIMRGIAYGIYYQIKRAKQNGLINTILGKVNGELYGVNFKSLADDILRDLNNLNLK